MPDGLAREVAQMIQIYKWFCDCGKIGTATTDWQHAFSIGSLHSESHRLNTQLTWTIIKEELQVA